MVVEVELMIIKKKTWSLLDKLNLRVYSSESQRGCAVLDSLKYLIQNFSMKLVGTELLCKASCYEYSAEIFHDICDTNASTIRIMKNGFSKILEGYTPIPSV